MLAALVGRRGLEGKLRWQLDSTDGLSCLAPFLRSSLGDPWCGARPLSQ